MLGFAALSPTYRLQAHPNSAPRFQRRDALRQGRMAQEQSLEAMADSSGDAEGRKLIR
jgi:hypothetical protein